MVLLPEWVVEWPACDVNGLWGDEFGPVVAVESDVPSLAMHDGVVVLAQQAHIAEDGVAAVEPRDDMVSVAVAGWALAGRKGAAIVAVPECVA